jgi:hypothetical protein
VANIKSKADIKSLDLKFCLIKTGNKKYTNAPSSSHKIQQHTFHLLPVNAAAVAVDHLRSGGVLYGLNLTDLLALKLILFVNLNSIRFRKLLLKSKTGTCNETA